MANPTPPGPDLPITPAPQPVSNAIIYGVVTIGVVTIVGVVVLAITQPDQIALVAPILAAGAAMAAAVISISTKQGVQVIHQQINSRMDAWMRETRLNEQSKTQLSERAAAEATAKAVREAVEENTRIASEKATQQAIDQARIAADAVRAAQAVSQAASAATIAAAGAPAPPALGSDDNPVSIQIVPTTTPTKD